MKEKKYRTIAEVSKLLDINAHVIRYWDSKFDGISTRLKNDKQRFFNNENITKLNEIKNILYQNGKHNYSLSLANKLINKKNLYSSFEKSNLSIGKNLNKIDLTKLKEISLNLKKLLNI